MSTKKDLKTGAIFEIELDRGIGYGYVKLLISHDIDPIDTFNLFIVKPYNVFSLKPIKKEEFNPKLFETDDILCFPPTLYFRPKLKGVDSWRYVGISELTIEDKVIPDYVQIPPPFTSRKQLKDSLDHYGWISYLNGLKQKREETKSFDTVKHLGLWPSTGSSAINRFLTMYWRKDFGNDPIEFYRKYMNGEYHPNPEFELIGAGLDLFSEDTDAFRKMDRIKRLKYLNK